MSNKFCWKNVKYPWIITSLILVGISLGMFGFILLPELSNWYELRSWNEVDAKVLELELKSRGGERNSRGDYTNIIKWIEIKYQYQVGEQEFESDVIRKNDSPDALDTFHENLHSELLEITEEQGGLIKIWINPDAPHRSVIERGIRWGIILIFFPLCILVLLEGVRHIWVGIKDCVGASDVAVEEEIKEGDKTSIISSDLIREVGISWIVFIVMTIFILPFFSLVLNAGSDMPRTSLASVLAGGIFLFFFSALLKTLRYKRYGDITLNLEPGSPGIGGYVGGYFQILKGVQSGAKYQIGLKCLHRVKVETKEGPSTRETVVFKSYTSDKSQIAANSDRLYFCFDLPGNLPETQGDEDDNFVWEIELIIDTPGVNFESTYEVNMSKTPGQTDFDKLNGVDIVPIEGIYSGGNVFISEKDVGTEIYYPPATINLKKWKVTGAVLTIVWFIGVIDFLLSSAAIFGVVFAFIGILVIIGLVVQPGISKWVLLGKDSIHSFEIIWGLFKPRKEIRLSDIREITIVRKGAYWEAGKADSDAVYVKNIKGKTLFILHDDLEDVYECSKVIDVFERYFLENSDFFQNDAVFNVILPEDITENRSEVFSDYFPPNLSDDFSEDLTGHFPKDLPKKKDND